MAAASGADASSGIAAASGADASSGIAAASGAELDGDAADDDDLDEDIDDDDIYDDIDDYRRGAPRPLARYVGSKPNIPHRAPLPVLGSLSLRAEQAELVDQGITPDMSDLEGMPLEAAERMVNTVARCRAALGAVVSIHVQTMQAHARAIIVGAESYMSVIGDPNSGASEPGQLESVCMVLKRIREKYAVFAPYLTTSIDKLEEMIRVEAAEV
jgi:hypothetical protein